MDYNYEKVRFNIESLEESFKNLTDENLKRIANVAIENINQIAITIALPHYLMMRGVMNIKHFQYLLEAAVATKNELQPKSVKGKKQIEEYIKLKFEENKKYHSEEGRELLSRLRSKSPYIEEAIRIQALNSLVNVWTVFESTSKEIWMSILNNYQDKFLNNIIESKTDEDVEGIIGKSISINLLGKYNFNVNKKLGNILSGKYDFTSCSGIKKAFVDLDRTQKDSLNFLDESNLVKFENLRNLIVHKAGIIDDLYIKKNALPNESLGKKITVNTGEYQTYIQAVISPIIKLLEFSDSIK